MTVQTNVKTSTLNRPSIPGQTQGSGGTGSLAFLGGGLLSFVLARKRRKNWWHLQIGLTTVLLAAVAAVGCGSSGNTTPKGTSTITVTGTSGSATHSATYSLTVQ
jgi:peptidoglycan/LPS O-acetylase OafA/YrhL